jgi:HD-like signal output (HDOD) protein
MSNVSLRASEVERDLRQALAERIERGALELPVLNQAATRVATLCNEPDAEPRELAETLSRDPALAGHVLRVSNSSTYAPVQPIVSLQQAISRLGMVTLGQIAFAVAVGERVFAVPGHESWARELWRHSALCAGWSREISRVRRRNGETTFLCGRIHDVGLPILVQAAADLLRKTGSDAPRELLEPIVFDLHGAAGARLAEAWKMPEAVSETMLHHHDLGPKLKHPEDVRTVALADVLAHWSVEHHDEGTPAGVERLRGLELLEQLGLYDDELETLLARREHVLEFAGALS